MRVIRIILFLGLISSLNSCNNSRACIENPYCQGCKIMGRYGEQEAYGIPNYIKNIKKEVNEKVNFSGDYKEILLTEIYEGGDGINKLSIIGTV